MRPLKTTGPACSSGHFRTQLGELVDALNRYRRELEETSSRRRFATGGRRRRADHAGQDRPRHHRPPQAGGSKTCSATRRISGRCSTRSSTSNRWPPSCRAICTQRLQVLSGQRAIPVPHGDHRRVGQRHRGRRRARRLSVARFTSGLPTRCRCWSPARGRWRPATSTTAFSSHARDEMGELADAMNDMTDALPRDSRRPRPPGAGADQASRPQRAAGQRRLPGRGRGARDQQSAGLDRPVQRIARRPARRSCSTAPTATGPTT